MVAGATDPPPVDVVVAVDGAPEVPVVVAGVVADVAGVVTAGLVAAVDDAVGEVVALPSVTTPFGVMLAGVATVCAAAGNATASDNSTA